MEYKLISNSTYCLRLNKGDEIVSSIKQMCIKEDIKSGYFSGIGAANIVSIGVFDKQKHNYEISKLNGEYEITSLIGNISTKDNEIYLHAHINVSDYTLKVMGGHLIDAIVSLTAEIFITKTQKAIKREFDQDIGINLIKF